MTRQATRIVSRNWGRFLVGTMILPIFLPMAERAGAMPVDIETARVRSAALVAVGKLFPNEHIALDRIDDDHYLATVAGCRLPVLVRDTPYSGRRRYGPRIFDILLGPPKC